MMKMAISTQVTPKAITGQIDGEEYADRNIFIAG
jgi:hypothetical protein